ncbi:MAG: molybdopterin cofactor-binding domain-containing protein [Candidatus Krumholzibacteriia bacterium]
MNPADRSLRFTLNGRALELAVPPALDLLTLLRELGCMSVKFSDEHGEGGADTVLVDDRPVSAATHLALQVEGRRVETLEGLRDTPWLAALAERFLDEGAVQCGYCTPALLLQLEALRRRDPAPDETALRAALGAVFCRCTGMVKPLRAARVAFGLAAPRESGARAAREGGAPLRVVGHDARRVDGRALVRGEPVFAGDLEPAGALMLAILPSPHAHARIRAIDTTAALRLPGVAAVLTWRDVPRRAYTSAGQGFPEPSPYDCYLLDDKVRHVGDKVALVAAETPAAAAAACAAIAVDYEVLPHFLDEREAQAEGAPIVHDEPRPDDPQADLLFWPEDPARNVAARTSLDLGDVDAGFAAASAVIEREYRTHQVQQCSLEPHVCSSWLDADGRLVIRSSTQVPFHVRRVVARLLDLPTSRVRVIKARVGGGFGGKQEILGEELVALMTLRTGRPVRLVLSRAEELRFARSRHPARVRYRAGFDAARRLTAMQMDILENTGANGAHALTVMSVSANKGLSLYPAPAVRHRGVAVYSNRPPAGAFRGYGSPQAFFALESFMDEAARELGADPFRLRLDNALRVGDAMEVAAKLGEGREGVLSTLTSGAIEGCLRAGREAIGWDTAPRGCPPPNAPPGSPLRRGLGFALVMQGSGIPGIDMAGAFLKMNEDGGFNLMVGAADIGTGSDTVLAQIAAEVLGVTPAMIVVTSGDTDHTPFDPGAYASSTTYISGGAVKKAAETLRARILDYAALLLDADAAGLRLDGPAVLAPDGRRLPFTEIGTRSLYTDHQRQLMASASHVSPDSPPPFAAQFAEIEVNLATGAIRVLRFVTAVDAGRVLNPAMAEGQVEGAVAQGLGMALVERMAFDAAGRPQAASFREHGYLGPDDLPEQQVIFVEDHEPTGPFGAKAVAEICINGPAPAVANALADATGVRLRETPLTPDRVRAALRAAGLRL